MRIKGSPRKGCKCYMRRWDIIQGLINKNKYKRYLEIGIWDITVNFEKISCPFKVCVDPNPQLGDVTFRGTSDAYFKQLHPEFKYDMVFVDGLHIHEQTTKDIYNSFKKNLSYSDDEIKLFKSFPYVKHFYNDYSI